MVLCPVNDPEAAVPQCDGDFGGVVGAVLMPAEGAKLLKIWSPSEGVAVTNRAGSASVTGSVTWAARELGNRNLTLSFCAAERNWSVVINRLSRPRLSKAWGGVSSNRQYLIIDPQFFQPITQTPLRNAE